MSKNEEITPSIIGDIYTTFEKIKRYGINEGDIIVLIQRRISPKMTVKQIKAVIKALIRIETEILQPLEKIPDF